MAVDKKKVIERIKAKWPNLNLSQSRLDAMADKLATRPADDADDAAIDAVLDAQNEILSFEDLAKLDDRTRTLEAENKKLKDNKKPNPDDPPKPDPVPDDAPEWAKALIESNKKLAEKVEGYEKGQTLTGKTQQVKDLFAKSDVFKGLTPEQLAIFERSIDLESETSFADQVKALETTAQGLIQAQRDNDDYAGPAGGGDPNKTIDTKAVEGIVDSLIG